MAVTFTKKELRTKTLTARLKPSLFRVLDRIKKKTGMSYADIIEKLIEEYLNEEQQK